METYSVLLKQIMKEKNMDLRSYHRELEYLDIDINYKSLSCYCNGTRVPPFDKAKEILSKENYEIEDNELKQILAESRKQRLETVKDDPSIVNIQVSINTENIDKSYEKKSDKLRLDLNRRIEELFIDEEKKGMSRYITYLIKKDLMENDFIGGEENE